jgi:hypothetical protein
MDAKAQNKKKEKKREEKYSEKMSLTNAHVCNSTRKNKKRKTIARTRKLYH